MNEYFFVSSPHVLLKHGSAFLTAHKFPFYADVYTDCDGLSLPDTFRVGITDERVSYGAVRLTSTLYRFKDYQEPEALTILLSHVLDRYLDYRSATVPTTNRLDAIEL